MDELSERQPDLADRLWEAASALRDGYPGNGHGIEYICGFEDAAELAARLAAPRSVEAGAVMFRLGVRIARAVSPLYRVMDRLIRSER